MIIFYDVMLCDFYTHQYRLSIKNIQLNFDVMKKGQIASSMATSIIEKEIFLTFQFISFHGLWSRKAMFILVKGEGQCCA